MQDPQNSPAFCPSVDARNKAVAKYYVKLYHCQLQGYQTRLCVVSEPHVSSDLQPRLAVYLGNYVWLALVIS